MDNLLGFRDVARSTDERTCVSTLFPRTAVGHMLPLLFSVEFGKDLESLRANLTSFVLDYVARQKVGGTHLTFFLVRQFPALPPAFYEVLYEWSDGQKLSTWLGQRSLVASQEIGSERADTARAELDAAFFHLYGMSHDEAAYIMDTFPGVMKNDVAEHGYYRRKEIILEVYDRMQHAIDTGEPYESPMIPEQRQATPSESFDVV